jgi:hypothetical protein
MPKRNSKTPSPDVNETAHLLVERSLAKLDADPPFSKPHVPRAISRVMSKMGRKGGKIGGKRRLTTMTPEERSRVASEAAKARWGKRK